MIYLDNAATTYPKPEIVYKALDYANRNAFNAGRGSYGVAREASIIKENVKSKLLAMNNFVSGNVIFSSSATNSLNDIIFGIDIEENDSIYISPFEHNAIIRPLEELKKRKNINIVVLPFNKKTWEPDLNKIQNIFAMNQPKAIFISQVSNVTGFLLSYEEIFKLGEKYKSINVLDASQGYGIVPIKNYSNINYIVFAGHKSLYASFGIAGYIKFKSDKLYPNVFGGTGSDTLNPNMPEDVYNGFEAGSPNIVSIYGLDKSIDFLNCTDIYNHKKIITKYLIGELNNINNVKLFIPDELEKIFGMVSIAIKGYIVEDVGKILDDEFNICVRTGYHCAPKIHEFLDSLEFKGTIRISIGYFTTKEEIDKLIEALKTL